MATKDHRLVNFLNASSLIDGDENETLESLLQASSDTHRHSIFLGKIYAVLDLAIHYNDGKNPAVNEIVEALIELGYAFGDDFEKEIDSDNQSAPKIVVSAETVMGTGKTKLVEPLILEPHKKTLC